MRLNIRALSYRIGGLFASVCTALKNQREYSTASGGVAMPAVKLFGVLRDRVKKSEVSVPPGRTLWEILRFLADSYGPDVARLLIEEKEGEVRKRLPVVVLVDGIPQTDLGRVVREGEIVSIFPAVAGG